MLKQTEAIRIDLLREVETPGQSEGCSHSVGSGSLHSGSYEREKGNIHGDRKTHHILQNKDFGTDTE